MTTAIGATLFAAVGVIDDHDHLRMPGHPPQWVALALGAATTLTGLTFTTGKLARLQELVDRVGELQNRITEARVTILGLAESELVALNNELKLNSQERISLYAWGGEDFELVARYSQNPTFCEITERHHPANEGCRWEAWCHGSSGLVVEAARGTETWFAAHAEHGMSRERIRDLRLRARTVIATRINSPRAGARPLGVLLVESESTYEDPVTPRPRLAPGAISAAIDGYAQRLAGELASLNQLR